MIKSLGVDSMSKLARNPGAIVQIPKRGWLMELKGFAARESTSERARVMPSLSKISYLIPSELLNVGIPEIIKFGYLMSHTINSYSEV